MCTYVCIIFSLFYPFSVIAIIIWRFIILFNYTLCSINILNRTTYCSGPFKVLVLYYILVSWRVSLIYYSRRYIGISQIFKCLTTSPVLFMNEKNPQTHPTTCFVPKVLEQKVAPLYSRICRVPGSFIEFIPGHYNARTPKYRKTLP